MGSHAAHHHAPAAAHAHADGAPHILPLKLYFGVWGALMVGTVLTVAASFVHIGPFNVPIMLAIATVKATLVALFFMHLWFDEKFNLVVFAFSMIFVGVFFSFTLIDVLTRGSIDQREAQPIKMEMDRTGFSKPPILLEPLTLSEHDQGMLGSEQAESVHGGAMPSAPDLAETPMATPVPIAPSTALPEMVPPGIATQTPTAVPPAN